MAFIVRLIAGRQEWYERVFREKALRLTTVFGHNFDITPDQVEDVFGEVQEGFGESRPPGTALQADDLVIGACRL
ncbi:MAG TPA: hypothetical protein VNN62_27330 [Methylomirabilota bacterium]|jgi:hypothetical protein|nr:hypothetical protein [Methylomirabilota bacterium]